MTGAPQLTHSTRGFAPPSVPQLRSSTVCYVFDNYCNLLLQFAFVFYFILLIVGKYVVNAEKTTPEIL